MRTAAKRRHARSRRTAIRDGLRFEPLEERVLLSVTTSSKPDPDVAGAEKGLAFVSGEVLIGFEGDVAATYRTRGAAAALDAAGRSVRDFGLSNPEILVALPATATRAARVATRWLVPPNTDVVGLVARLSGRPGIAYAEPNGILTIQTHSDSNNPADPSFTGPTGWTFGLQEHLPQIHVEEAWDVTQGDTVGLDKVIVAVIDTGVDLDHPDLNANLVAGKNFVSNKPLPAQDDNGHGTHVAGIIAAEINNMDDLATQAAHLAWKGGTVGVAPQARIMPVKVLDARGSGSYANVAAGIKFAADNWADIINMSLGGGFSQTIEDAINYAYDVKDVLVISAAGNGYAEGSSHPASSPRSLSVAAVDKADIKAPFSNYGFTVDVAAPGVSILSTFIDVNGRQTGSLTGAYGRISGTSMATPNAAGVAALIQALNPTWSAKQVATQLLATASNIDAVNPSFAGKLGAGRVNAQAAVGAEVTTPFVIAVSGLGAGSSVNRLDDTLIGVQFSHVMDGTGVLTPGNYELLYLGANGVFGGGDDLAIPLAMVTTTYDAFPGRGAQLRVDDTALDGNYQFRVKSAITSEGGTPLADYVRTFSIVPTRITTPTQLLPLGSLIYRGSANDRFNLNYNPPQEIEPNNTLAAANTNGNTLVGLWFPVGPDQYKVAVAGNISPTGEADYYRLNARAGDVITIALDGQGSGVGTLSDPYVELRNSSDAIIAQDDDGGVGLDSLLSNFVIPADGAYYIKARSYADAGSGTYKLIVDLNSTTNPGTPSPPVSVPAGDVDKFVISLDGSPDQVVAVAVAFPGASVSLTHNGNPLLTGSDLDPGLGVLYWVGPLAAGPLEIAVQAPNGLTTGPYTVAVTLNPAVTEVEAHDATATAQNIDAGFLTLASDPSKSINAQRAAVQGAISGTFAFNPTGVLDNFDDGNIREYSKPPGDTDRPNAKAATGAFHDGAYGLEDKTNNGYGGWNFRDDAPAHVQQGDVISVWVRSVGTPTGRGYFGFGATSAGTYSMQMAPNTGQLILGKNVNYGYQNLAAVSQSWLPDHWYRFEIDWKPGGQIIGRLFDSDGVTLLNVLSATDTTYTSGGIAFRSFDSTKHFDTVQKGTSIQTTNPDYYAFHLDAGQAATLTVTKLNNSNVTVQALGPDGNPVAGAVVSTGTTNVDGAVVFVAPTPGTYYAKVTGEILAQYRVMVARGAAFDLEDINDAPATAQDITVGKVSFGHVGGINVLWVGYESSVALSSSAVVTRITPAQLATQSLAGFGAIVIDDSNTLSVLQSRASDIAAFVSAGGGLVTDQGGAANFSWVPNAASLAWTGLHGDDVTLTAAGTTHPVTAGTTNADLSNWGNSYHTVFTATAGMDVLTANSASQAHTLAGLYGSGRLVYFGLHPTAHQPIGDSLKLIRQSVAWANGTNPADVDYYKITLDVAATRSIYTLTPGGGPGEFVNNLNPGFQIIGPDGTTVVATAIGPGNQTVILDANVTGPGTYTIRVFAEDNTFGEYILIDPPPAETEIVATGDRTPTGPIDRGQGASSMTTGFAASRSAAPVIAVTGRHTRAVNSLLTIPSHEDARHHTARTQAAGQAITSLLGSATRRRFGASLRPHLVNELFAKPTAVFLSASPTSLRLDLVDELFADSELLAHIERLS